MEVSRRSTSSLNEDWDGAALTQVKAVAAAVVGAGSARVGNCHARNVWLGCSSSFFPLCVCRARAGWRLPFPFPRREFRKVLEHLACVAAASTAAAQDNDCESLNCGVIKNGYDRRWKRSERGEEEASSPSFQMEFFSSRRISQASQSETSWLLKLAVRNCSC
jgi:hypothetical protein